MYVGGDDLLFFAPVAYHKNGTLKTIFDLLADIDRLFASVMTPLATAHEVATPTLSYGVSINYYKFPLNEMRDEAYRLLMYKAKNKAIHPAKNCIEFILRKHSGQKLDKVEKDVERDFIMNAQQAKEYGIIDDIIYKTR